MPPNTKPTITNTKPGRMKSAQESIVNLHIGLLVVVALWFTGIVLASITGKYALAPVMIFAPFQVFVLPLTVAALICDIIYFNKVDSKTRNLIVASMIIAIPAAFFWSINFFT